MTQSGLGFIDINGHIKLPHDVLRPLSIRYNSFLWGIYYPKNHEHDLLPDSLLTEAGRHDYMITPVSPYLWKVSARIILKLSRGRGIMAKISEFFADKDIKVSILHAKSSRSSHRFSTWVLHVAIVPLISAPLEYDEMQGYYLEVKKYLEEKIHTGLIELHKSSKASGLSLLFDKYDVNKSVETHPNSELHFFDWVKGKKILTHSPFAIKVSEEGSLISINNDFVHQLKDISKKLNQSDDYLLNTPVYSEFDSRGLNMRLFIFPKLAKAKFFEIGIDYEYRKDNTSDYSCIGLIASVTNCISKQKYSIWQSCNYTTESAGTSERGKLIYLVEDTDEERSGNSEERLLKTIHNRINDDSLSDLISTNKKIEITNVIITQLSNLKIKRKIDLFTNKDFKFDVFISFSMKNKSTATLIENFLDKKGLKAAISTDIPTGEDFYKVIGHNLRYSREMILLYSDVYHESNWRKAEEAAFWAFGRVITPILLSDMDFERLDKFIDKNNGVKLLDISDPNFVTDLEEKLERIVRDIKDRKALDLIEVFERTYDK